MNRSPFIFVLIDGNKLLVSRQLVAQGPLGGYIAAKQIRTLVERNLWQHGMNTSRLATTRIVLFADLGKLDRLYPQKHLPLKEFFAGFDSTQFETTFHEIDRTFVSRKSLEVVLTRALHNPSCRHVVFLGPSWEIFKSFGNRLIRQGQIHQSNKTLIMPPSEAPEDTRPPSTVSSDDAHVPTKPTGLRRNHGVTIGGVKMIYDPSLYLAFDLKRDEREHDPTFAPWLLEDWATRGNDPRLGGQADSSTSIYGDKRYRGEQEPGSSKENNMRKGECDGIGKPPQLHKPALQQRQIQSQDTIPRNRTGQRVDPPVNFEKNLRSKMQKEGWCSNHHLKGSCPVIDCRFRHGSLDENGRNALLSLTRGNSCRNGNDCEEQDCYAGHHCPYDPCTKENNCHFPSDMHIADRDIFNIDFPLLTRRRTSDGHRRQCEGKGPRRSSQFAKYFKTDIDRN